MLRVACDQMAGIVAVGFGDLQCCFAYGCNVVCICIIGNTCSFVFCFDRFLARCFDDSRVSGQMAGTVAVVFVDLQCVGMHRFGLVVSCRCSVLLRLL